MEHETFLSLLRDPSHWEFEIFLMILFDGILGGLVWGLLLGPWVKKKLKHHVTDDEKIARLQKQVRRLRHKVRRFELEQGECPCHGSSAVEISATEFEQQCEKRLAKKLEVTIDDVLASRQT